LPILFLLFVLWLATLPTAPGSSEKKNMSLFVAAQHPEIIKEGVMERY